MNQQQMHTTDHQPLITRIAQLRHRHMRRRVVERLLRKFTSRKKAATYVRFIP